MLAVVVTLTSSCTEFALFSSTAGVAVSHNVYAKAYSGVDFLTIIQTEKDIKTHVYNHLTASTPWNPPSGSGSSTEQDHLKESPHPYLSSGYGSERKRDECQ